MPLVSACGAKGATPPQPAKRGDYDATAADDLFVFQHPL